MFRHCSASDQLSLAALLLYLTRPNAGIGSTANPLLHHPAAFLLHVTRPSAQSVVDLLLYVYSVDISQNQDILGLPLP